MRQRKGVDGGNHATASGDGKSNSKLTSASGAGWLSANPLRRDGEAFFLKWSVVWIAIVAYIVISRVFEIFTEYHYMAVGCIVGLPCMFLPLLFPPGAEASQHWTQRYTTKANVWLWIQSFNANYFWTHYFYKILACKYTFPSWRFNDVPIPLYLMTQSYFAMYHVVSTIVLRATWRRVGRNQAGRVTYTWSDYAVVCVVIAIFSYIVAFMETFTIQNFPYYSYPDSRAMYLYGSVFYGLYFIVSFPMFHRIDEDPSDPWTLSRATIDGFAASMLITIALDFWRVAIGPIITWQGTTPGSDGVQVPFIF